MASRYHKKSIVIKKRRLEVNDAAYSAAFNDVKDAMEYVCKRPNFLGFTVFGDEKGVDFLIFLGYKETYFRKIKILGGARSDSTLEKLVPFLEKKMTEENLIFFIGNTELMKNQIKCLNPWLITMQRYGPPPSYSNCKTPSLSAPKPVGEDTIEKSTDSGEQSDSDFEETDGKDFRYLLKMTLMSLSREMKDKLLKEKGTKISELEELKKKSPSDMWKDDLYLFMEELTKTEDQEMIDDKVGMKGSDKMGKGKNALSVKDTLPSSRGQRIIPFIDAQTRIKVGKAIEVKKKKRAEIKTETAEDEDSDAPLPLSKRIGTSSAEFEKKMGDGRKSLKQSKINFKTASKKEPRKKKSPLKKKKIEWFDSESNSDDNIDISCTSDYSISTPSTPRHATQATKKYTYSDSGDDLDDLEPRKSPSPPPARPKTKTKPVLEGSEIESEVEEFEEEEEEEKPDEMGLVTPDKGLATPSALCSVIPGMETSNMIELRKRKIESDMELGEKLSLYSLVRKTTRRDWSLMMGFTQLYDNSTAMPSAKVRRVMRGFAGLMTH